MIEIVSKSVRLFTREQTGALCHSMIYSNLMAGSYVHLIIIIIVVESLLLFPKHIKKGEECNIKTTGLTASKAKP